METDTHRIYPRNNKNGEKSIRILHGDVSDASILRLAKIQEKLAG
jgi:hypothetical protein